MTPPWGELSIILCSLFLILVEGWSIQRHFHPHPSSPTEIGKRRLTYLVVTVTARSLLFEMEYSLRSFFIVTSKFATYQGSWKLPNLLVTMKSEQSEYSTSLISERAATAVRILSPIIDQWWVKYSLSLPLSPSSPQDRWVYTHLSHPHRRRCS